MRSWGAVGLRCAVIVLVSLMTHVVAMQVSVAWAAEADTDPNAVYVRQIVTDPSDILTEGEIEEVVHQYEGRIVTIDELFDLVERINARYAAKGYVTAQAVLPPQTVEDGVLYIMLIEGRVGEISVRGNDSTQSSYVTGRITLQPGDLVRLEVLEADIERFNATNDVQLSAQLQAGETFGTTDVVLVLNEPPRLEGSLFYRNSGRSETGVGQTGVTLTHRSVLGLRDALNLSWHQASGSRSLALTYDFPASRRGSRLTTSLTQSEIGIVEGDFAEIDIGSKTYGTAVGWSAPLVIEPGVRVDVLAEYQENHLETYFSKVKISSSQVQRFSFGFSSQNPGERRLLQMHHTVTVGTAREGHVERSFAKYNGSLTHQALVTERDTLRLRVIAQLSTERLLPPSEQFSLGGGGTVRGYPSGKLTGDQGYFVSADITSPLAPGLNGFLFLDHGAAYPYKGNDMPATPEDYATSIGGGLTLTLFDRLSGNLVYGIPVDAGVWGEGHLGTLHLNVELRF